MSIGIYKITNTINNKVYIGQSVHIEKRWYDEKRRAFDETAMEYDYPRSRAFRKYGLDHFLFEIVEECTIDQLNEREQYYINLYNSVVPHGYNITIGGSNAVGVKLDLSKVEEITELLQTTTLTHKELGTIFGVSENMICGINTGYYWKRQNITYPIRERQKIIHTCKDCGKILSIATSYCNACCGKHRRVTERPEAVQLAQEILDLGFSAVGRKYGVSDNAIRKWCINYGMPTKKTDIREWLLKN